MRLNKYYYFCNCLTPSLNDHETGVDDDECCVYCNHFAVYRQATEKDIRLGEKHKDKIQKLKLEALEIHIKDKVYNEKVN